MPLVAERAEALLAEGHGLDAVLAMFEDAELATLHRLIALRDATGLGLQDAMRFVHHSGPLAHVTAAHLALLAAHPKLPGEYGDRIRRLFLNALTHNEPELALAEDDDGDGIWLGRGPDRSSWWWMDGDLAALRQAVEDLADHPLGGRVTLTAVGLRFLPGGLSVSVDEARTKR
ncbi:hypothetical protein [Streptodolium elevatio]